MQPGSRIATFVAVLLVGAAAAGSAETIRKSGYALSDQTCGALPTLRIGMRPSYCAGLVASKDDGLIFPRTIVQIPGHDQFVVADMGGWIPGRGRLLLVDPALPAGKRVRVLVTGLDFPFGLAAGPGGRVY